jgi:DNA-binding transcriptional LysR family regulator
MDRLDDMALFARVAETRSFTVAAAKLGLSRSAASRRMTELEGRLGARLLNRTTRRISLTEAGETYLARVQQILADVDDADRSVASLQAAPRGVLKVAAPMSFGMQHLGPAIADFLSAFPDIEVEMDLNDRYVDLVDEGYDVAVRIGQLKDSSLVAKRICPARVVHAASPAYLTRRGVPRAPEDLAHHDCLIYTNIPQGAQWLFRTTPLTPGAARGGNHDPDAATRLVKVNTRLRANNGDVLLEAACAGVGIVALPTFICGKALAEGRVVPILQEWAVTRSAINAVFPANRHLSSKVRVFVDFLADRFGPNPYWDAGLKLG